MMETIDQPKVSVRKTLIIEDDRVSSLALSKILEMLGQEVHTASTLAEGFEKLDPSHHCVLLDLMLPDGDGVEILRHIRAQKLPVRVAVTTGLTDPASLSEVLSLKPDAIFHKPLHPPDIARWLSR
jgi:DNA-binding response OmpR family regulator